MKYVVKPLDLKLNSQLDYLTQNTLVVHQIMELTVHKPSIIIHEICSLQTNMLMCVLLLGHEGEGLGADGGAGHQADGDAPQRSRVVNTHDCVKSRTDRVDVGLLAVLVASSRIQDVPSVQDQDEHMDLGRLQTLLGRGLLTTAKKEKSYGRQR